MPATVKCVPSGEIDNKAALVQVVAWRRTCKKPLHEPTMTQLTGVYMGK